MFSYLSYYYYTLICGFLCSMVHCSFICSYQNCNWMLKLPKRLLDGKNRSCTSPDFNSFLLQRAVFFICHSIIFSYSLTVLFHHCLSYLGFRRTDEVLLQESLAGTIRNTLYLVCPLNSFFPKFLTKKKNC